MNYIALIFGFRSIRRRDIESSGAIGGQNIVQIKCPNKMSNYLYYYILLWGLNSENSENSWTISIWKSESLEKLQKIGGETIWKYCKTFINLNLKIWKKCKNVPSKVGKVEKGQKIDIIIIIIIFFFLIYN